MTVSVKAFPESAAGAWALLCIHAGRGEGLYVDAHLTPDQLRTLRDQCSAALDELAAEEATEGIEFTLADAPEAPALPEREKEDFE